MMKKPGIALLALLLCLGARGPMVLAEETAEAAAEEISPETEEINIEDTESTDSPGSYMPERDNANDKYTLSTAVSTDYKNDYGEIRFLSAEGEWTVNSEIPEWYCLIREGETVRFAPMLKSFLACETIAVDEKGNEEIIEGNEFTMPDHAVELRMEILSPHVYTEGKNGTVEVEVNGEDTNIA